MNDMILILDYSATFSVETAKRLRAEQVYAKIVSSETSAEQIRMMNPRGIILSGENDEVPGTLDAQVLSLGVPVLAMGHASHMLLLALGGSCAGEAICERKASVEYGKSALFAGLTVGERYLGKTRTLMLPTGVEETASAAGCTMAFENAARSLYGVQFELERNDPDGTAILKNFARDICGATPCWTAQQMLECALLPLAQCAAKGGHAVCTVSGGVDSMTAAALTKRAFGERMVALFVDTGLMRDGEGAFVQAMCDRLDVPLLRVDRSEEVLCALAGKHDVEQKREVINECLRRETMHSASSVSGANALVLGMNYSDLIHYGEGHASAWQQSGLTVLEPLCDLFKDEVRLLADTVGLPEEVVSRKPFPMLGLAGRILGEVTNDRLQALRMAEEIFSEELAQAGLERKLYKFFPILAGGDLMKGHEIMVLRAVTRSGHTLLPARLPYDLVERTVSRIMNSAPMLSRVLYDQTPTTVGKEAFC